MSLCEAIVWKDESLIRVGGNLKLRRRLRQMMKSFTCDDLSDPDRQFLKSENSNIVCASAERKSDVSLEMHFLLLCAELFVIKTP